MAYPTDLRAEWSEDHEAANPRLRHVDIASPDELDDLLDRLDKIARDGEPIVVELISSSGGRLGVGLGAEHSVLTFKGSDDPPYFQSAGRGSPPSNEEVGFYFQGHWSEFPQEALVPARDARRAAQEFMASRSRPEAVEWEEV